MKPLSLLKLLLLCQCSLLQFTNTRASFSFTFEIISHSTSGNCDTFVNSGCETFFPGFCLRGPRGSDSRSTSSTDCPFGRNDNDLFASGSRTISSSQPWQGGFQLFFEALDDDGALNGADHLAYIFIDRNLDVGTGTTAVEVYPNGRVTVQMSFRVDCLNDYYREDCAVFCVGQNSDQAGYYTCNGNDGSRVCLENYYGPNCVTFCQESNNEVDGFYSCNEDNGALICNEGFAGNSCTANIDDCAGGPCENGGTCTDMVAGFACDCPAGYTGVTCLDDINECLEANCPGNSTCVEDALDSFLCQCNSGFEGENCTEIQPCETAMCENGGSCVSEDPFSYECLCPPGFNGTSCENDIDECYLVECRNGGTCVTPEPSTFECICPEGFNGSACEFDVDECLLEEACPVGTSCINDEPGFRCVDASQQVRPRTRVIIIGSAVGGGAVIIVILILIILTVLLLTRRKMKYYRADRSQSHIYQSPSPEQVKCASLASKGHIKEGNNPLYGTQIADTAFTKADSPEIHTFENSIYEASSNHDTVIYDQIRTNVPKLSPSDSSNDVIMSANVSYESLRSPYRKQAISNPMYATTGGDTVTSPPPTYSVPKPVGANGGLDAVPPPTSTPCANGGLQEMDGYTILKDGRNSSLAVPAPSSGELESKKTHPASAVPLPQESSSGSDTSGTELGYALPATVRCASREGPKYKKLQHTLSPSLSPVPEQQPPVVRLAALPDSGYTALETES